VHDDINQLPSTLTLNYNVFIEIQLVATSKI